MPHLFPVSSDVTQSVTWSSGVCGWKIESNNLANFNNLQGAFFFLLLLLPYFLSTPSPTGSRCVCRTVPRRQARASFSAPYKPLGGAAPWRTAGRLQTPSRRFRAARAPASPASDHSSPATCAWCVRNPSSVADTTPKRRQASGFRHPGSRCLPSDLSCLPPSLQLAANRAQRAFLPQDRGHVGTPALIWFSFPLSPSQPVSFVYSLFYYLLTVEQ